MDMNWFLGFALITTLVLSVWIISNLLNQISILENNVRDGVKSEDKFIRVYENMIRIFTEALAEMKRIDKRGSFSSDDEVGFAFKVVLESIEQIKYQLESIRNNNDDVDEKIE
jgi:hypothetical protein